MSTPSPSRNQSMVAHDARIRLGAWMTIAGTLGALLAFFTYIDVWNASDNTDRPVGWLPATIGCVVLTVAGLATLWRGMRGGSGPGAGSAGAGS